MLRFAKFFDAAFAKIFARSRIKLAQYFFNARLYNTNLIITNYYLQLYRLPVKHA